MRWWDNGTGKNRVIAGDYNGREVTGGMGMIQLYGGRSAKNIPINKSTVEAYELVTDEHRKSAAFGAARGLVGGALLGSVGALAGGLSASNKGIYIVAVQFNDGKKSLLEVNDKLYKLIVSNCFAYSGAAQGSASSASARSRADGLGGRPSKDDYAVGINCIDSPMPGYKPYYVVNKNNKLIAVQAVSTIDSFLKDEIDGLSMKEQIDNLILNVSHENTEENRFGDFLSDYSTWAADEIISINADVLLKRPIGSYHYYRILSYRNNIARMYLVDEKVDVRRTAKKILNTVRGYLSEKIDKDENFARLLIYHDTLRAYLGRTPEEKPSFNDEDINRLSELAWKFRDVGRKTDDAPSDDELKAIADEISSIVSELPSEPSVDVYYKTKESAEQASEPEADKTQPVAGIQQETPVTSVSPADEIRKYKELLDDGIITEEEFDAKKKKLLGL